jgi:hypothetical protein
MAEKWIQGAIKHPGSLHKKLNVPMGEKIPSSKITKAMHSKSSSLRKEANFAHTLKKINASKKA